jgi:hypothetical protein
MHDRAFFTAFVVWGIVCLVVFIATIWVAVHFISKWW